MIKVLADHYLYQLDQLIPGHVQVTGFDPEQGLPENVTTYDALLVRTVIPFNNETLPDPGNIRFIGTASAGYDHLDLDYLNSIGIHCEHSAGCNANAVAEYILTVLYRWANLKNVNLRNKSIGIVGCGNTGRALSRLLRKLNLGIIQYDPPKEMRDADFQSSTLTDLLQCNILSFHTPLTVSGTHATYHMCNADWLQSKFDLVINAARGGVVDEKALLDASTAGLLNDFVLDVWENEPAFSDHAARNAFIATPHIAGYSKEAKKNATFMIVEKMCDFLGIENPTPKLNSPEKNINLNSSLSFADFLWKHHKVSFYDGELRKLIGLNKEEKSYRFAKLRSETELRTEFQTLLKQVPRKASGEFGIFS